MPSGVYVKSEEHRRALSLSKKGKPNGKLGTHHSEETKRRISESNKGNRSGVLGGIRTRFKVGHVMTTDIRLKISKSLSGANSHLWRGGITPYNLKLRTSLEYKLWREAVFKRDNYQCVLCHARGVELHADHIKPFALFPDLRLVLTNGRTLCVPCHKQTATFAGRKLKGNII